jgi:hypothetical protein
MNETPTIVKVPVIGHRQASPIDIATNAMTKLPISDQLDILFDERKILNRDLEFIVKKINELRVQEGLLRSRRWYVDGQIKEKEADLNSKTV